jgi:hypothetical protein
MDEHHLFRICRAWSSARRPGWLLPGRVPALPSRSH